MEISKISKLPGKRSAVNMAIIIWQKFGAEK